MKIHLLTVLSLLFFSPFVSFADDKEEKSGKKPETEAKGKSEKSKAKSEESKEKSEKGKSETAKGKSEKGKSETAKSKSKGKSEKEGGDEAAAEMEEAKKLAGTLTKTQRDKLADLLNKGTSEQLEAIEGISASKAEAIIQGRPFKAVEDVIAVKGIGKVLYSHIIDHGKASSSKGKGKAKE